MKVFVSPLGRAKSDHANVHGSGIHLQERMNLAMLARQHLRLRPIFARRVTAVLRKWTHGAGPILGVALGRSQWSQHLRKIDSAIRMYIERNERSTLFLSGASRASVELLRARYRHRRTRLLDLHQYCDANHDSNSVARRCVEGDEVVTAMLLVRLGCLHTSALALKH